MKKVIKVLLIALVFLVVIAICAVLCINGILRATESQPSGAARTGRHQSPFLRAVEKGTPPFTNALRGPHGCREKEIVDSRLREDRLFLCTRKGGPYPGPPFRVAVYLLLLQRL